MPDLDIIEISDQLAYNARLVASGMSEPQIRKRGMIDILGINCAVSYLQTKKLRIDTKRSVHTIPILFEEFKITDIYYGNYRIDVITLYKEKTIKIPKIHFNTDIIPDFYFVVQIGSRMKEAKMIGFIEAKSVLGCSGDSKFYYPTLDLIFDLNKFIAATKRSMPSRSLIGRHADCMGLFLKFIDNDLSSVYKSQMIQHLMSCDSCRSRFIDTMEFEKLANNIRHYPNLVKKYEHKIKILPEYVAPQATNDLEESLNKVFTQENVYQINNKSEIEYDDEPIQQESYEEQNFENDKQEVHTKIQSKKVIDSIFDEMKRVEVPQFKTIVKSKYRHAIIAMFVIFVILVSFAFISIKNAPNLAQDDMNMSEMQENLPNNMEDISQLPTLYDEDDYNPTHEARLLPNQRDISDYTITPPAQSQSSYTPSVAKISWEVPKSLIKKEEYTKFLQLAGKNIKLNLQNDLLLVNDIPINRLIALNIKVAANGDVQSVEMNQTSGSASIDASINKVVKDTLRYMKPPAHGIIARPVSISLTIELK